MNRLAHPASTQFAIQPIYFLLNVPVLRSNRLDGQQQSPENSPTERPFSKKGSFAPFQEKIAHTDVRRGFFGGLGTVELAPNRKHNSTLNAISR